jgi:hypothetical protein
MKALLDAHDDLILGFTMLGAEAGEVVAVVQTAMVAGLPFTGLRDAIVSDSTLIEWAQKIGALFIGGEVRHFEDSQYEEAWRWLQS